MIIIRLDRVMAHRKLSNNELVEIVGITHANISRIKTGKIKAVKLSTMNKLCKALRCQPGDIFEYVDDLADEEINATEATVVVSIEECDNNNLKIAPTYITSSTG